MIARGRCSVNATTFSRPTCAYLPGDSLCTRTHCAGASEYPREQYPRQSGYEGLALQRDGGDVELVEVTEDGIVKVRLQGACRGCPMAQVTLQMGIEQVLKKAVPEVKAVEAVA